MDKQGNYFPILENILQSRTFEQLSEFKEDKIRAILSDKEKTLLSFALVLQGEKLLERGDESLASTIFDDAILTCPSKAEVYYHVGMVYLKVGQLKNHSLFLSLARQNLESSLELQPDNVPCMRLLGSSVAWLASASDTNEMGLFEESERIFHSAEGLIQPLSDSEKFHFYWSWAAARYLLGRYSGEVVDFRSSIDKFQKALEFDAGTIPFWNEYGHALSAMALLLSSPELFLQAKHFYELSVNAEPARFEGWFYVGITYHELFEISGHEDDYLQAHCAYEEALRLKEDDAEAWIRFGHLLVSFGKLEHDQEAIESSIEKFAEAEQCHPSHPLVYSGWGEALMLLGMYREELPLLMEAKEKIVKGLEISPEHPDIWGCYGSCLYELGRYFQDEQYFRLAIQKFQYGLSLDNRRATLWLGAARAHYALAEQKKDLAAAEEAASAAAKAVALRKMLPLLWTNLAVCLLQMAELSHHRHYVESAVEKLETALQLFNKEEDHHLYLETLYHYGYALDFLGDFDLESSLYQKAIQLLTYVVDKESGYFQARYALASTLLHLGELTDDQNVLQEALSHFRYLAEEDAEDFTVFSDWGVVYLNLAYLSHDTGRPDLEESYLTEAEDKLQHSIALGGTHAYYFLACLYTMKEQFDVAMHYIEKAENFNVLPSLDDLLNDEWLDALRETQLFNQFIHRLKTRSQSES